MYEDFIIFKLFYIYFLIKSQAHHCFLCVTVFCSQGRVDRFISEADSRAIVTYLPLLEVY